MLIRSDQVGRRPVAGRQHIKPALNAAAAARYGDSHYCKEMGHDSHYVIAIRRI